MRYKAQGFPFGLSHCKKRKGGYLIARKEKGRNPLFTLKQSLSYAFFFEIKPSPASS
jgi:hypothetical protein